MDKLYEQISSYDILNNILPGSVIYYLITILFKFDIPNKFFIEKIFIYYFIGLLCSRIGSLIIEPLLKKLKIIKYANYDNYIAVEKIDNKITILTTINNMYRTFLSGFLILLLIIPFSYFVLNNKSTYYGIIYGFIMVCFIVFLCSFKKQTSYIRNRVIKQLKKINTKESNNGKNSFFKCFRR